MIAIGDREKAEIAARFPDLMRRVGGYNIDALVADGLRWLHRTGAASAVVNTQEGNDQALALYLSLGFIQEPAGLTVLSLDLEATQ